MGAPTLAVVIPQEGDELNGTITLTCDVAPTGTGILGVAWKLNGNLLEFIFGPTGPFNHVLDTTTLPDGDYTITCQAVDNSSPSLLSPLITVNVTINNTNPSPILTVQSPPQDSRLHGQVTLAWTPITRSDRPIWFTIIRLDSPTQEPPLELHYTAPWTFTLDTATLSNGPHTLWLEPVTFSTDASTAQHGHPVPVHFESNNAPAHPPINRYGQFRTPHDITVAVVDRLNDWQAEYVDLVGTANLVPLKPLRSVIPMTDLQRYPENKLPCAVVVVGSSTGEPQKDEDGYYSATYNVVVGVVATASSEYDVRRTVYLYGQAVKMALGQRRGLTPDVTVQDWTGESVDPLDISEKRRLLVHTSAFTVRLDNIFSWKHGPGPDAQPPVPSDPPLPPWPDGLWTDLDLTITKEPIT